MERGRIVADTADTGEERSVAMGPEYSIDRNARGDSEQSALQNVHLKR